MKKKLLILGALAVLGALVLEGATRRALIVARNNADSAGGGEAPFSPSDLPNLHIWHKADAITGYGNGANLDGWLDSSGNGNHATNNVSGEQPIYQTGIQNGLAAVLFDNTDDTLTNIATTGLISANGFTIFLVEKASGAAVNVGKRTIQSDGANCLVSVAVRGTAGNEAFVQAMVSNEGFNQTNAAHVAWLKLNNGASEYYIDGTNYTTTTTVNNDWPAKVILGAKGAFTEAAAAWICELIIYTNALNATQTTNVFEHLREKWGTPGSAAFTPTQIAGLSTWVAADQSELSSFNNGDPVNLWTNKGGALGGFTNGVSGQVPIFTNSAVNGKPAVIFDGSNDYMKFTDGSYALAQPLTIFAVWKQSTVGARQYVFDGTQDGGGNRCLLAADGNTSSTFINMWAGSWANSTTKTNVQWAISSCVYNNTSSKYWHQGTNGATITVGSQGFGFPTVGANHTFNGDWFHGLIAEIIAYTNELSTGDRQSVEDYLSSKYAITLGR